MEFEAGESIIPPEMNAAYDHDEHALPSVLHRQRAKEHGEWVGFNANSVFNDGLMVKLLVNDGQVKSGSIQGLTTGFARTGCTRFKSWRAGTSFSSNCGSYCYSSQQNQCAI